MFKQISDKVSLPDLEKEVLDYWQKNNIFEKSIDARQGAPDYTFHAGMGRNSPAPPQYPDFPRACKKNPPSTKQI